MYCPLTPGCILHHNTQYKAKEPYVHPRMCESHAHNQDKVRRAYVVEGLKQMSQTIVQSCAWYCTWHNQTAAMWQWCEPLIKWESWDDKERKTSEPLEAWREELPDGTRFLYIAKEHQLQLQILYFYYKWNFWISFMGRCNRKSGTRVSLS